MIELIKEALNQYFSDYKEYQIAILIGFTLLIAIIQFVQAIWISRTIEKYKAELKRTEIKFSRYHNLQVDALKSIYTKLVLFHGANTILLKIRLESDHDVKFEKCIDNWIRTYNNCINEFSLEKILLPNELKELVGNTLKRFDIVKDILIKGKDDLVSLGQEIDEDYGIGKYEYDDRELVIISTAINKLVSENKMEKCEESILSLRKSIEDYFEDINKSVC